jgi:quercetin dioxygenase-like cupin family protein
MIEAESVSSQVAPDHWAPSISIYLGLLLLCAISFSFMNPIVTAMAPERPRAEVQPICSDALPHVPGKRITTVLVEFPPSGYAPKHRHAGSVTVYVLSGAIRSQLSGSALEVYKAGQTFFEPPGTIHLVAENASDVEPARILAVFVADEGATLTTYLE